MKFKTGTKRTENYKYLLDRLIIHNQENSDLHTKIHTEKHTK